MIGRRRAGLAALGLALLVGACGGDDAKPIVTFPPVSFGTGTTSAAATETLRLIEVALRAEDLAIVVSPAAFRTGESPTLAAAPRIVAQVVLPDDPEHGYVTIYELHDAATAEAAGRELAAYVGGGVGRVQFPPGTAFVVRTVGPTVVFFTWSADDPTDPWTPRIAAALGTVGAGIDVPR